MTQVHTKNSFMKKLHFFHNGYPNHLTEYAYIIANLIIVDLDKGESLTPEDILQRIKKEANSYAKLKYQHEGVIVVYKATQHIEEVVFKRLMELV